MARTQSTQPQLRPLAPKPATGPGPLTLPAQPNILSQRPVFNDSAAGPPVTMGDEPYRNMSQRLDSPSNQMTIEQLVDTRLCVSALTPQMCHQMMGQLDDRQIKNAVYDRALCFPFDQWTENIRLAYGRQVQHDNEVITTFDNMSNHMEALLATWRNVYFFKDSEFDSIEAHIKSYLAPSVDNIGVYSTFSDHTLTKINGLTALLKVGQIIMDIPILVSKRGVILFAYDPLSRAVGNILSTTTTDTTRRQILSPALEGEFLKLVNRAATVGLFPGLLRAITSAGDVCPYNIPRGDQLAQDSNKRVSTGELPPAAKRSKVAQGGRQYMGQAALDQQGAPTPGSSRASSNQPGQGTEQSGPHNPFSRPASAGPIAKPFAKSTNSTPAPKIKSEDEHTGQEQIEPSLRALSQGAELQGIAQGAAEYHPVPEDMQQMANIPEEQSEQAMALAERSNTGIEALQRPAEEPQQLQQAEQAVGEEAEERPSYDDMLLRVENEVFHLHASEPHEVQLQWAPAVVSLVEGTAGMILKRLQAAACACHKSGRHDHFLSTLHDTVFSLLWVLESCAINVGRTTLSAEVSSCVSRDTLVGALWGSVRLASAAECLDLLDAKDNVTFETFSEKLERIIRKMDETGVTGFGDLRFVLENMRSGVAVPVQEALAQPDPSHM